MEFMKLDFMAHTRIASVSSTVLEGAGLDKHPGCALEKRYIYASRVQMSLYFESLLCVPAGLNSLAFFVSTCR
jgi:hypothetical protein